ncbi:VOC family protein [Streptomyces sp. NPDC005827]|uniref:VOC family protein n=1 Tax=Streptomyces sp. NPDC005827 TaxID=3157070 RepID=UPI0033E1A691
MPASGPGSGPPGQGQACDPGRAACGGERPWRHRTLAFWPAPTRNCWSGRSCTRRPGTAVVAPPQGAVYIAFQEAPGYRPPVWPPADGAQRTMMHLDFRVADLDEAVAEAVALGASLAPEQPQAHVRVLFDPAGHPFCLCRDDGWRSVRTSPARGTTAGCAPCVRASGWSPVARRGR